MKPTQYILGTKGTEKRFLSGERNSSKVSLSNRSVDAIIFHDENEARETSDAHRLYDMEIIPIPDRNCIFENEVAEFLGQELDELGGGIKGFSFENEDGEYLTFGWASQDIGYSYETADGDNIANVYSGSILFTPEEEANWIKNVLEQLQFKLPKVSYQVIYKCMVKIFGNDVSGQWAKQFSKIVADAINNSPQDKQEETLKTHLLVDASWNQKSVEKFIDGLKKDGII